MRLRRFTWNYEEDTNMAILPINTLGKKTSQMKSSWNPCKKFSSDTRKQNLRFAGFQKLSSVARTRCMTEVWNMKITIKRLNLSHLRRLVHGTHLNVSQVLESALSLFWRNPASLTFFSRFSLLQSPARQRFLWFWTSALCQDLQWGAFSLRSLCQPRRAARWTSPREKGSRCTLALGPRARGKQKFSFPSKKPKAKTKVVWVEDSIQYLNFAKKMIHPIFDSILLYPIFNSKYYSIQKKFCWFNSKDNSIQ